MMDKKEYFNQRFATRGVIGVNPGERTQAQDILIYVVT